MAEDERVSDDFVHPWVAIPRPVVDFAIQGAKLYAESLKGEVAALREERELAQALGKDVDAELDQWSQQTERFRSYLEEQESRTRVTWVVHFVNLSHLSLRVIKTFARIYLNYLTEKRNRLAASLRSQKVRETIDQKLDSLAELVNAPVFAKAENLPLLVEQTRVTGSTPETTQMARGGVIIGEKITTNIEVQDPELRGRCLDIFNQLTQAGSKDRYDTVIREATTILENRIRVASGADPSVHGVELLSYAFAGRTPKLAIGETPDEKGCAHLFMRGIFGIIRNPPHHRLVGEMQRERIVQLLGTVDYALHLVDKADRLPPVGGTGTDITSD